MSADIAFATIEELGAQLRNRQLSCEEVVRATLHRIERLDRQLNTFITLLPERAIAQAKAAERQRRAPRASSHAVPGAD